MELFSRRASAAAIVLAGLALLSVPLDAHHSFAPFDISTQKTIAGTVKQVDWTNPHTWVWLNVQNEQGGVDVWGFEGMSPNYLGRRGWTKRTLQPGDQITVTYRPLKDGSHGGSFMSAKRPDGTVLMMTGEPTDR
jgi:hypothetical protein